MQRTRNPYQSRKINGTVKKRMLWLLNDIVKTYSQYENAVKNDICYYVLREKGNTNNSRIVGILQEKETHDNISFWGNNGLKLSGHSRVVELKKKWKLN